MGLHWHNLANTIEPSTYGGDAGFLSNYFDHLFCYYHHFTYALLHMVSRFNVVCKCFISSAVRARSFAVLLELLLYPCIFFTLLWANK